MLSEFAVPKLLEQAGQSPTRLTIEWPSSTEDDVWVTCGQALLDSRDVAISAVAIQPNEHFSDEITQEYPGDAGVFRLELETLVTVVAYYLPGMASLDLASEVDFTATVQENTVSARLHPGATQLEFEPKEDDP